VCAEVAEAATLERSARGSFGSSPNSLWISSLNGSSFDGRSGTRNTGGASDRNARLIVFRANPSGAPTP
jgi:hypothetical protein